MRKKCSVGKLIFFILSVLIVTALYAQPGDDVRQIMSRYGALCEITLDDGRVLPVMEIDGTVSWVYVDVGSAVFSGNTLFTVCDGNRTGGYGSLVLRRQKIESQIAQLFRMLRDGYAAAPGDGMIVGTDASLVSKLAFRDEGGLRVTLLAENNRAADTPEPSETTYLSGTISSALDSACQATVTGVDGVLDFSAFPDAKRGDTVFLQKDVYTEPGVDGAEETTAITYPLQRMGCGFFRGTGSLRRTSQAGFPGAPASHCASRTPSRRRLFRTSAF